MKRKRTFTAILVAITLVAVTMSAALLTACADSGGKDYFTEEDLAKSASVTSNTGDPNAVIDGNKHNVWKTAGINRSYIDFDFGREVTFNTAVLREKTDNVKKFRLYADRDGAWEMIYEQDRILPQRICYLKSTTTSKARFEIIEVDGKAAEIRGVEFYNAAKKDAPFKVVDYMRMDYDEKTGTNALVAEKDDPAFTGYFEHVSDIIIFGPVGVNSEGEAYFYDGEKQFAEGMDALGEILAGVPHKVNVWVTVFFGQDDPSGGDGYDYTAKFLKEKRETINASIRALVEKYGFYGVDYDWEYPQKQSQWDAYGQIVTDTAEYTKVSVALPSYGIKFKAAARKAITHVNLMLYDMFDSRGDHSNTYNACIAGAENVIRAGFEREQIMMGIPTYGRATNNSNSAWPIFDESLGEWGNVIEDYQYIEDGVEYACDCYLNGYAKVRDKTAAAIAMELGGVMLFRMRCDAPATSEYSLHKAVSEVIDQRLENRR